MAGDPPSKLANREPENCLRFSAKCPFSNGEKRLTGHNASNTRAHARDNGDKNYGFRAAGTPLAIKDKILGGPTTGPRSEERNGRRVNKILANIGAECRPHGEDTPSKHRPQNRKIGRFTGGPQSKVERNRLGRRSTALRLSEVRNILAAADFAEQQQWALNRHTTIHFEAAGIGDPVAALRQYTKLARDWLRTQGAQFAYVWVRESGDAKGEHAHLLMHIPAHLIGPFARRERGWRKRIHAKRALGAFHSTPVGRSYSHAEAGTQFGQSYRDHLAEIVGYLVKGAEPRAVEALSLGRVQFGGELWGKRTGMSENIGRAARARLLK